MMGRTNGVSGRQPLHLLLQTSAGFVYRGEGAIDVERFAQQRDLHGHEWIVSLRQ